MASLLVSSCLVLHNLLQITSAWSFPLQHERSRLFQKKVVLLGSVKHNMDAVLLPDTTVANLLLQAGINTNITTIEILTDKAAFCNTVYRIRYKDTITNPALIAKVFSSLALQRMDATRPIGHLDGLAASAGVAPKIAAACETGILMEDCTGTVLTEDLVHGAAFSEQCSDVGTALARLHCLPVEPSTNMLWKACNVMLSLTDEYLMDTAHGWSLARLYQMVERHREQLESLQLPLTASGHGDCKPANVVLDNSSVVKFIDLELAGTHYRAFDIAKFWRTSAATGTASRNHQAHYTQENRRAFYQGYSMATNDSVETLELEADLLLPLAWLEAAIFFCCMATQDSQQATHWNMLATDRLYRYSECMQGKRLDQLYL